ncbi:hypothetical protein EDC94DRAFT_654976 [Helicostylum pulchrum]|nr:hypothetical protein EDC94DRAFT_654976 [Helicostylum pulchrum]
MSIPFKVYEYSVHQKHVTVSTHLQLDLLMDLNSHLKDLVHHIKINTYYYVITNMKEIGLHFTELKSVYAGNSYCRNKIWKVVKSERPKGLFSKLQMIPFDTISPEYSEVVQYNALAWSLRNMLRKLNVYDVDPAPTQNAERLSHFRTVDTIDFKLLDVDCSRCKDNTYHTPIQVNPTVHVLSQIKQLDIRWFLHDYDMYPYVMQVFSNLDSINLLERDFEHAGSVPLSTEFALQFVRYPLRITYITVGYIPFKNLEQVMMEFYNRERIIKKFGIKYNHNMEAARYSSYLSIRADKKYEMFISINYAKESPRLILPRVGMIEHNGDNFQNIKMNMGLDFDAIDLLVVKSTQEGDLSSILSKCLNVKNISVACTLLRLFGTSLQQQKIPFVRPLELDRSLVYGSFLLDMSFHLPFIDEFVVNRCRFDGDENNITINMSNTKFTDIVYNGGHTGIKVYLKLTTLENNTTRWFFCQGSYS